MDFGRSINYFMRDPDWIKKVLIGGVVLLASFVLIGVIIALGYLARVIRNVHSGVEVPLPEWDDWSGDLSRGIKLFIAILVWTAPIWLIGVCVSFAFDNFVINTLVNCATFILSILVAFVMPLVVTRVALADDISAAFDFNGIIEEAQKYARDLVLLVIAQYVLGFVAMIGLIACFIGVFVTGFIAQLILFHLYAQMRLRIDGDSTPPLAYGEQTM